MCMDRWAFLFMFVFEMHSMYKIHVCMCILLEAMLSCSWICLISYNTNQSLSVALPLLSSLPRSPALTHLSFSIQLSAPSPFLTFFLFYSPLSASPPSHALPQLLSPRTYFPLCQTFLPLHFPSPTRYTSPSLTDGKQVLFSQLISSFPPCCFVALVLKWRECRGIWVSAGAGEKWERCPEMHYALTVWLMKKITDNTNTCFK